MQTQQLDDIASVATRTLTEIFPSNNEAAAAEVVTEDYRDHEAPDGAPTGPAALISTMRMLSSWFSDQHWEIEDTVTQGDVVAIRCLHSGRHTGEFFGIPPTGSTFSYRQMHFIRMRDGKGAEHWGVRDDSSLMRQLTAPAHAG
jgi:predicted ester cyclase